MEGSIVLYPHPSTSHLLPMLELASFIAKHHPSFLISIIILSTPSLPPSSPIFSANNPSIKFIHLPPVIPSSAAILPNLHPAASFFELPQLNNTNLRQALLSLSKTSTPKAFIADFFCSVAVEASSSLNIPSYFFYTSGASGLCHFLYWYIIDKKINESAKSDLDEILIGVPGTTKITSKEVPAFLLDPSLKVYKDFIDTANHMAKSDGIIVNSFEVLEPNAVKALEEGKCSPYHVPPPPIYCIGPLLFSEEKKEEHECLTWLDSQPSRSVVFLCFGSMGVLSASQLKEMGSALEKSGVRFLWVVRNPPEGLGNQDSGPKEPNLENLLPEGFLERTKGRGFVVKDWAPQRAILNHRSVGGFVSHCGWNSILEAICAGVPMLAWPLYAEQKMNKVFLVEDMKLALPVQMEYPEDHDQEGWVNAAEFELRLIELMKSKKGDVIRNQVMAIKEAAMEAMSDGGSSTVALDRFVGALN